jgi:hypothetical protein
MWKIGAGVSLISCLAAFGPAQAIPSWQFGKAPDRMTDKVYAVWVLQATDTGGLNVKAELVLRCHKGDVVVWVSTGTTPDVQNMKSELKGLIGTLRTGDVPLSLVNLRFDSEKVIPDNWERRSAVEDLYAPNGKKLIRKLMSAKVLLFRFDTFTEGSAVYRFDVDGLGKYQDVLKAECKY